MYHNLFICLFMDIWIVANFWLQIKLLTKLDFPSGSVSRPPCLYLRAWAWSLVGELGSGMLCRHTHKTHTQKAKLLGTSVCGHFSVFIRLLFLGKCLWNTLFGYEKYLIILMTSPNRGLVGFRTYCSFWILPGCGFFLFCLFY